VFDPEFLFGHNPILAQSGAHRGVAFRTTTSFTRFQLGSVVFSITATGWSEPDA
jgi:hypothetical protein